MHHQDLLPPEIKGQLLDNGRRSLTHPEVDPTPVVKLFMAGTNAAWLLTEIDPNNEDRAFGLCQTDHRAGDPKLAYVSISELRSLAGIKPDMVLVRDHEANLDKPLSAYLRHAQLVGRIETDF
jgi:hypothetical protein